jgi:hypothetical protein
MPADEKVTEEHQVPSERLVSRVKELVKEGNVRRIIVKNHEGHTILEIPLTLGVLGALLLPSVVALGAVAGLAADYKLVVERSPALVTGPAT